jgi:replicative DNA helicase
MRSCPQGGGKTRMAVADACKIAVPYFYDVDSKQFVYSGNSEPTTIFSTEMPVDEIQTLIIATVSKVNEEHILFGNYDPGELDRVTQAIEYILSSPLYIVHIPDFSIEDIKNQIKKYNREFSVRYFFFDYVHTSLRLMAEVNSKSGMGLKEHQLLLVFATELKTIAQQLEVFIFTASQLNGEAQNAQYKDQNLLAGSKALANKLDMGIISMAPTKAEMKKIEPVLHKMVGKPIPNMCHWIYKVRRGKLTRIIIWSKTDLGTMTEECLFVTNYDFELIDMDFTKIEQVEEKIKEHSVLITQVPDTTAEDTDEEDPLTNKKFDW